MAIRFPLDIFILLSNSCLGFFKSGMVVSNEVTYYWHVWLPLDGERLKKHIALIDDDQELLSELKDLLESEGYNISTYNNPVIGFSELRANKPDLILLDIKMEGLTGIQLAALIRLNNDTREVPIIFISGNVREAEIIESMQICDIKHYLEKPINVERLLAIISNVLTGIGQ